VFGRLTKMVAGKFTINGIVGKKFKNVEAADECDY
jgi:hypothetical protein